MPEWVAIKRSNGQILSIVVCEKAPDIFPADVAIVPIQDVPMAVLAKTHFWSDK